MMMQLMMVKLIMMKLMTMKLVMMKVVMVWRFVSVGIHFGNVYPPSGNIPQGGSGD